MQRDRRSTTLGFVNLAGKEGMNSSAVSTAQISASNVASKGKGKNSKLQQPDKQTPRPARAVRDFSMLWKQLKDHHQKFQNGYASIRKEIISSKNVYGMLKRAEVLWNSLKAAKVA